MKKRLFAMLLTLCMVMALLPTAAFAEESADSTVRVSTAEELQNAVNKAEDDTEVHIQLTANIDAGENCALTVPENKYITLDLNGHDMTSAAAYTVLVNCSLNIMGKGTVRNTAETDAVTIINRSNFYMNSSDEDQKLKPSVACEEGNVAIENRGVAHISAADTVTGYVDCYGSTTNISSGIFYDPVRSCIESGSLWPTLSDIHCSGRVVLNGGIVYNFDAEDIADVPEKTASIVFDHNWAISQYPGFVSGELTAVGNATFKVTCGNFENPVDEAFIPEGYVQIERKNAEGATYYSVFRETNETFHSISGNRLEKGVPVQEFDPVTVSNKTESYELSFFSVSNGESLYAAENTTVNGTPITIEWDENDHCTAYAEIPLAVGDNDLVIRCKATDGTEYTYYLTVARKAADGEEPFVEVSDADELQEIVDNNTISYIKLTDDIDAVDYYALSVPAGKVVTLDMNGHDITSAAECTIFVENRGKLTVKGEGTISNTAEEYSAAIYNCGTLYMTPTVDEEWNYYYPSVACNDGNSAVKNWGYASVSAEEVTGYVDSYGGSVYVMGTFHDTVRSYVDEEGYPAEIDVSGVDTVLKGGVAFNFSAEDIAEYVTEKEVYISISGATVMGELKAVGNATIEVRSGNFEQPVAEEYLVDECVCVERKDAEGKTYYSVVKSTDVAVVAIRAFLYSWWPEAGIAVQNFEAPAAIYHANEKVTISFDTDEIYASDVEAYALENTTVNGQPLSFDYSGSFIRNAYIEQALAYGDNLFVIKTKAADGTEYTYNLTITRAEAPKTEPETPVIPPVTPPVYVPETPTGTVTKPDGSTVTTERDDNGSKSETVVDKNGMQTTEVTVSNAAVREAVAAGEAVTLPMPSATATKDRASAPTVTVDLPYGVKTAKVEIPVENVSAGTVAVIVHADGTEEVVRTSVPTEDGIALTVENGATVKIIDNSRDFGDVAANHTFNDAIDFASARGIIEGYGNGNFAPGNLATSNAVVTIISRIMGNDFYGSDSITKANDWAKENGITLGLDTSGNITRGSFMIMLWRAAGCPVSSEADTDFADASALNDVEKAAFAWAVENGVISGYGDGTVRPDAGITRGAMAAIAQRYMTR